MVLIQMSLTSGPHQLRLVSYFVKTSNLGSSVRGSDSGGDVTWGTDSGGDDTLAVTVGPYHMDTDSGVMSYGVLTVGSCHNGSDRGVMSPHLTTILVSWY